MNEKFLCLNRQKCINAFSFWRKYAFSLIEMLMALLVASMLLAALAPVMTRKMDETVNVSGVGTYERLDYAKAYYENKEWLVPAGVNIIKVTAVGGGGAGGSATYGYKKFNYTGNVQNFTVPAGVTKIRVYAIAGGGGGSAGADGTNIAYGNIPAIAANTEGTITTAGSRTFANGITPPDTYKVPAINQNCKNSGFTNWTLVSDNSTQLTPNTKISKIGVNGKVNVTLTKVTACGGGGGSASGSAGAGGAGGSGGYVANKSLNVTNLANSINIRVGGGGKVGTYNYAIGSVSAAAGGAGGSDGVSKAANGSSGSCGSASGCGLSNVGGGGGGAATTVLNGSTQIFQIGGGGGGGGGAAIGSQGPAVACAGGMGGNGVGAGAGCAGGRGYTAGNSWYASGGGGGGGGYSGGNCTYGKNATEGSIGTGGNTNGSNGWQYYVTSCVKTNQTPNTATSVGGTGGGYYTSGCSKFAGGGGGGGGMGGRGGQGGSYGVEAVGGVVPNSIFPSNCNGGNSGYDGKPGAIKLWYSAAGVTNGLKCTYYTKTNAGNGGGAGQIWIGEVNVTAGETLSVNIGKGGNGATVKNGDGTAGGSTIISGSKTGSIITLTGGNGGSYTAGISGISGGCSTQKPWKNWTGLSVFDASNQTNLSNIGNGKTGGKASDNNFTGGKGGQTYSIENTVLEGGTGGAGNANGNAPSSSSYGTGGGGGGGNANVAVNTAGLGGSGGNGYVYIEWGEGSGGGGQSGQVIVDNNVWVAGGRSKVKMIIGKGGNPAQDTSVNWSGLLGKKGGKGEDTIVMVDDEVVLTAKGGYGGNPGILSHGTGGGKSTSEKISNTVAGDNGANEKGGNGASLIQSIFPLLGTVDKITSAGGLGGSISTSGEGKAGSGYGAGGGGGIFLNNKAYQGGKGSNGMVYIEYKN